MVDPVRVAGFWFAVAVVTTIARIASRISDLESFKRLQLDDFLIIVALLFFASQVGSCVEIVRKVDELQASAAAKFNLEDILRLSRDVSKLFVVFYQGRICTLWLVKWCLLILDCRITNLVSLQHTFIKIIAGYVVVSFLILEICFFFVWCRPFHERWGSMKGQCGIPSHNEIMDGVLNITSDIAMVAVMVPMLARTALPRRQKFFVCSIFAMGGLIIACAVAGKYYAFKEPTGTDGMPYFVREAGIAIVVANVSVSARTIRKIGRAAGGYWSKSVSMASSSISSFRRTTTTDCSELEEDTTMSKEITVCTTIEMSYTGKHSHAEEETCGRECQSWQKLHEERLVAPWLAIDPEACRKGSAAGRQRT